MWSTVGSWSCKSVSECDNDDNDDGSRKWLLLLLLLRQRRSSFLCWPSVPPFDPIRSFYIEFRDGVCQSVCLSVCLPLISLTLALTLSLSSSSSSSSASSVPRNARTLSFDPFFFSVAFFFSSPSSSFIAAAAAVAFLAFFLLLSSRLGSSARSAYLHGTHTLSITCAEQSRVALATRTESETEAASLDK